MRISWFRSTNKNNPAGESAWPLPQASNGPPDEHLAARQAAQDFRGRNPVLDCIVSYLFPEIREWAEECTEHVLAEDARWWIDHTLMTVETACRHARKSKFFKQKLFRTFNSSPTRGLSAALLQIHQHGEAVWPFLELLLEQACVRKRAAGEVKLLCRMRTPALIPALMAKAEHPERAGLERLAVSWPAAVLKSAYEIPQPFRQLGRETYALTEDERQNGEITRFKGRRVSSGGIMGLTNRGWEWSERDGIQVTALRKRLAAGLSAELEIMPGVLLNDPLSEPAQEICSLLVRQGPGNSGNQRLAIWGGGQTVDVTGLDPIVVSEIIRDVDLLGTANK